MAIIQAARPGGSGGGGGGLTITGWANDKFVQTSNFTAGSVVLALSQTPVAPESIALDYNGQTYYLGDDFTLSGTSVTILFADPYVTDYDDPPIFHVRYPY